MLILPIGHDAYIRKIPYATFGLIIINILIFLITSQVVYVREKEFIKTKAFYDEFRNEAYTKHAKSIEEELQLDNQNISLIKKIKIIETEVIRRLNARILEDYSTEEFDRWDKIRNQYEIAKSKLVYPRFGLVPAEFRWYTLITSIFVHAGFLHLFGNMLFLYLVGSPVEDRWGIVGFSALYFLLGIIASLAYILGNIHSMTPCIGASGAISGLMGVFLFRFPRARIKFFYLYIIFFNPRFGTFSASAKIMLPLWLAFQVGEYIFFGDITSVALLAHIGGFIAGSAVAILMNRTGLEYKLFEISENLGSIRYNISPKLIEANKLFDKGKIEQALKIYRKLIKQNPDDFNLNHSLFYSLLSLNRLKRAMPFMKWLVEYYREKGLSGEIISLYNEIREVAPNFYPGWKIQLELAKSFEELGQWKEAVQAYNMIVKNDTDEKERNNAIYKKALIFRDKLDNPGKAILLFQLLQANDTHAYWAEVLKQDIRIARKRISNAV